MRYRPPGLRRHPAPLAWRALYTPEFTTARSLALPLMAQRLNQPAVHAPEFPAGLDWIHTGGRPITLADLRGKIVLLDFWTYG